MTDDVPGIRTDVPTSARAYGWLLGGKDNYEADRRFMTQQLESFPAGLDITRQNRLFLYRAVRYLATECGIRQFLDMGCGLPTDNNVHQVAQRFATDPRVVYVDNDAVVQAHGRVLLAQDSFATVIDADLRDPDAILAHPGVEQLIDLSEPVAVLFLSVGHHLTDADDPRRILDAIVGRAGPGSHLAFTQVVCDDAERARLMTETVTAAGIPWQTRSPAEVDALLAGLDPALPGLCNVARWREDPDQPPLAPVPPEIAQFEGASRMDRGIYEYGGVLRVPVG